MKIECPDRITRRALGLENKLCLMDMFDDDKKKFFSKKNTM